MVFRNLLAINQPPTRKPLAVGGGKNGDLKQISWSIGKKKSWRPDEHPRPQESSRLRTNSYRPVVSKVFGAWASMFLGCHIINYSRPKDFKAIFVAIGCAWDWCRHAGTKPRAIRQTLAPACPSKNQPSNSLRRHMRLAKGKNAQGGAILHPMPPRFLDCQTSQKHVGLVFHLWTNTRKHLNPSKFQHKHFVIEIHRKTTQNADSTQKKHPNKTNGLRSTPPAAVGNSWVWPPGIPGRSGNVVPPPDTSKAAGTQRRAPAAGGGRGSFSVSVPPKRPPTASGRGLVEVPRKLL